MKAIVDDLAVNYADQGSGPVILLLHGWGADSASFSKITPALSGYRVIVPDLPGFGASQRPAEAWDIGQYSDWLVKFLTKIKVETPLAIVAHSFGGRIAIKAVGLNLIKPQKLILMGSAGIRPSESVRRAAYRAMAKIGRAVTALPGLRSQRQRLRRRLYNRAGASDYLKAEAMREIFLKAINEDLQNVAGNIEAPTLLIWGETDAETPLRDGRLLADRIKGSRLAVIAAAGHFAYLDQPDRVINLIKDFVK